MSTDYKGCAGDRNADIVVVIVRGNESLKRSSSISDGTSRLIVFDFELPYIRFTPFQKGGKETNELQSGVSGRQDIQPNRIEYLFICYLDDLLDSL